MTLLITNALDETLRLSISNFYTLEPLYEQIYKCNPILIERNISLEEYKEAVQLLLNGKQIALDALQKEVALDKAIVLVLQARSNEGQKAFGLSPTDIIRLKPPEIPDELYCPFSKQVYVFPVQYKAYIVEKEWLLKTAIYSGKCPLTREFLGNNRVRRMPLAEEKYAEVMDFYNDYQNSAYFTYLKDQQYKSENVEASLESTIIRRLKVREEHKPLFSRSDTFKLRTADDRRARLKRLVLDSITHECNSEEKGASVSRVSMWHLLAPSGGFTNAERHRHHSNTDLSSGPITQNAMTKSVERPFFRTSNQRINFSSKSPEPESTEKLHK
ncbi:MAG: hypothetical protein H0U75_03970 [Legionella sp.]|nr:hypothetical protein [Legionella sp.]